MSIQWVRYKRKAVKLANEFWWGLFMPIRSLSASFPADV